MSDGHDRTEGGDPVCWLNRVCDTCGAFREDTAAPFCARCGAPFPDGDPPGPAPADRAPADLDPDSTATATGIRP